MKTHLWARLREEKGAIAILAALAVTVLLSMSALALDYGLVYVRRASLQSALDSAALAAASALPDTVAAEALAYTYMSKNGHGDADIEVVFEYNDTVVKVNAKEEVETTFARLFNVNSVDMQLAAGAKREQQYIYEALGYLLFSGNGGHQVNMGGVFNIQGSVHSNGGLNIRPGKSTILGSASSCGYFYIDTYNTTVGKKLPNSDFIPMPDFRDQMLDIMPSYYETVLTAATVNARWWKQEFIGNTKIVGNCNISNQAVVKGNLYVEGDLTISGGAPVCTLDGNIYATGKIFFGNDFIGTGCVFAGKDISFTGGFVQADRTKAICLYSEKGNISLSNRDYEIHGMIYAPEGTVSVVGGNVNIYGSIIANKINYGSPANLRMYAPDVTLPFELSKAVTRLVM